MISMFSSGQDHVVIGEEGVRHSIVYVEQFQGLCDFIQKGSNEIRFHCEKNCLFWRDIDCILQHFDYKDTPLQSHPFESQTPCKVTPLQSHPFGSHPLTKSHPWQSHQLTKSPPTYKVTPLQSHHFELSPSLHKFVMLYHGIHQMRILDIDYNIKKDVPCL